MNFSVVVQNIISSYIKARVYSFNLLREYVLTTVRQFISEFIYPINRSKNRKPRNREVSIAYSFTRYVNDHKESHEIFGHLAHYQKARRTFHTLILGLESCPTTGKPHIQGYVFFNEPRTLHHVHRMISHAHIEPSRESPMKNYEYCIKCGDVLKIGNIDEAQNIWDIMQIRGERGVPQIERPVIGPVPSVA